MWQSQFQLSIKLNRIWFLLDLRWGSSVFLINLQFEYLWRNKLLRQYVKFFFRSFNFQSIITQISTNCSKKCLNFDEFGQMIYWKIDWVGIRGYIHVEFCKEIQKNLDWTLMTTITSCPQFSLFTLFVCAGLLETREICKTIMFTFEFEKSEVVMSFHKMSLQFRNNSKTEVTWSHFI